jgi:outer membrane protein assembly factor BamE (lipoprotein component of BamABCDE complex)
MMKFIPFTFGAILCLALSACAPTKNVRGNLLEPHVIATVEPGVDNASDVMRKLGSPTTRDPFDTTVWYYIGQRTEKRGILDPEIKEESIYVARFAPDGKLASLTQAEGKRIDLPVSREKTPTSGQEMTFFQQMLGNVGRFNRDHMAGKM